MKKFDETSFLGPAKTAYFLCFGHFIRIFVKDPKCKLLSTFNTCHHVKWTRKKGQACWFRPQNAPLIPSST